MCLLLTLQGGQTNPPVVLFTNTDSSGFPRQKGHAKVNAAWPSLNGIFEDCRTFFMFEGKELSFNDTSVMNLLILLDILPMTIIFRILSPAIFLHAAH